VIQRILGGIRPWNEMNEMGPFVVVGGWWMVKPPASVFDPFRRFRALGLGTLGLLVLVIVSVECVRERDRYQFVATTTTSDDQPRDLLSSSLVVCLFCDRL
jgi:hypothetical protein